MNVKPNTVRAFIAIQLPECLRTELQGVQAELKSVLPPRSTAWPRRENLHLTLRFLGELDVDRLPELQAQLHAALAGFGPLELDCGRLGCFPNLRFPKVVWAWVHDTADRLPELVRRMNLAVAGFTSQPEEARIVGHVTLARPKQITRPEAHRLAAFVEGAVNRRFGSWACREVVLLRSELAVVGRRYNPLDAVPLAG